MDLVGASDAALRRMVETYERETSWAPPHVAEQLREAHESRAEAEREALQQRIEAMESESDERRQELAEAADSYDSLTESLAR